ncbi:hypothetical protein [Pontibacter liquoris]|uniref:hypothetical protein n=1 Tax=Pontibacter liquoris TaxID=2905677 RepID=UPI001FA7FDB2|nr:hypothetical protein [Pontibacter liquoris]
MRMSSNYKFMLQLGGLATLLNMLLHLAVAWVLWHDKENVPLWGKASMVSFMFIGGGLAGFIVGYVVTKATRYALLKRWVFPLHWHLKSQTLIDRLPRRIFYRSFMLALSGVLFAFITLLCFKALNLTTLAAPEFLIFISLLAFLLASTVTVMAFYRALGDGTYLRSKMQLIK